MSNHTTNNNCSNSFILNTETLYGYETGECHIVKIKETEKNLKIPELKKQLKMRVRVMPIVSGSPETTLRMRLDELKLREKTDCRPQRSVLGKQNAEEGVG